MSSINRNISTFVVSSADSAGRYVSEQDMEKLKDYFQSGEQRARIANFISANNFKILQETIAEWSLTYTDILTCNTRQHAACVRDLDYFLRYLAYVTLAGDSSILSERFIYGYKASYIALNIPINSTLRAVIAMQEVIARLVGQEDGSIMTEYFDYLRELLEEQAQNIQNNFVAYTQFSQDWQFWEPKNPEQWLNHDKLAQQIQQNTTNNSEFIDFAEDFFESLSHLPYKLRRQIWREREIMSALYERINYWQKITGFASVSVAKRNVFGKNRLVGIISFIQGTPVESIPKKFDIPDYICVNSSIADLKKQEEEIPLILEESDISNSYNAQYEINSGNVTTVDTTFVLQGGDKIAGINNNGSIGSYVTLTTFVKPKNSLITSPYILTVRHGFSGYTDIVTRETKVKIAEVICNDIYAEKLDIVFAQITLDRECRINPQLKWADEYPKKPIPIFAGMPVQMYGGSSGHVLGTVNESMILYPGSNPSIVPHFSANISSQPGDSGALLVVGHNSTVPVPEFLKEDMYGELDKLAYSMQGVLLGGSINGIYGNKAIFRPMITVLHWLKLEPYVP